MYLLVNIFEPDLLIGENIWCSGSLYRWAVMLTFFSIAWKRVFWLHDVSEDRSVSGFRCRALTKRATSYTIFNPPHKKKLQRHISFAAKYPVANGPKLAARLLTTLTTPSMMVRSSGSTMPATKLCLGATSICEMLYLHVIDIIVMMRLSLSS